MFAALVTAAICSSVIPAATGALSAPAVPMAEPPPVVDGALDVPLLGPGDAGPVLVISGDGGIVGPLGPSVEPPVTVGGSFAGGVLLLDPPHPARAARAIVTAVG